MCGIYGTTLRYSSEVIKHKLHLMQFRGPDNTGISTYNIDGSTYSDQVVFGHVRLSIIDLDIRSNQPFDYNDRISIVFNGEVYNHKQLKKQYLNDVTFRTTSDTEVICAMYERFGKDCLKYFNGMFAFVIYDKARNILFGSRDRLGKKPFYYWHTNNGFEFASQLKCIAYGNHFEVDETTRTLYLLQGVIHDPFCIYRGVSKLRAGECFTYCLDTNKLEIEKYWDIHTNSCGFVAPKSYEEAKEKVKELLFDAVNLRLDADVPVGTFLSGGIDSSLVCAIVSKLNKDVCAYTARFENKEFDESIYAVETAKHLGVPIKVCECSGKDLLSVFDDYLYYFDEPFADDSLIPTSIVAQKAREDVTVILGGDGGDELFYGYPKYEWTKSRIEQYKKPYWLRKLFTSYFYYKGGKGEVFQSTQRDYADVYRSLGMFCYSLDGCERFNRIEVGRIQHDSEYICQSAILDSAQKLGGSGIMAYTDYDIKTFMNAVNQKVDRATMRCSMELRSPIMDYRVAEYSRLLPYDYQYGKYGLKTILKDILYDMVPRELLDRPKRGFVPPTADWLKNEMKDVFLSTVTSNKLNKYLPEVNEKEVESLRDNYLMGNVNNSRSLWIIYNYLNWCEVYAK